MSFASLCLPALAIHFQYEDAHANFANLDLLIATINVLQLWDEIDIEEIFGQKIDRVNTFYSTPEYYTRMKYRETVKSRTSGVGRAVEWPVKKDDFFPYSDGAHNFWTGYFTSRAAFKRFERVASSFLLAARQIEAMPMNAPAEVANSSQRALFPLEDALGISQHHDAVSGTAKQHVADDYSRRLQVGIDEAAQTVTQKLRKMLLDLTPNNSTLENLSYCQLLNESICEVSEVGCILSWRLMFVYLSCLLYHAFISLLMRGLDDRKQLYQVERTCTQLFIIRLHLIDQPW